MFYGFFLSNFFGLRRDKLGNFKDFKENLLTPLTDTLNRVVSGVDFDLFAAVN